MSLDYKQVKSRTCECTSLKFVLLNNELTPLVHNL